MIRHIVLLDLPDQYDRAELASVMQGLDNLRADIAGFVHFEHGPNRDFEGMSGNCAYAFTCSFEDEATSRAYLGNSKHMALGKRLVGLCRGGPEGVTVVDMETAL
ncbi:MAG: Dabb family protein [Yoonia sp.]|uniref:Dabb family protein n=1 Tax=Yoonia sp. TaxID=2212373 RepID=UPI003EFA7C77